MPLMAPSSVSSHTKSLTNHVHQNFFRTTSAIHIDWPTITMWSLLCLLLLLPSCSQLSVSPSKTKIKRNAAIILIPGYYGTRLVRESDGELIWISPSEALFGDQPLTLPVPGLELNKTIELRPDTILDRVQVIPLIYSVDVYGSLLELLRSAHEDQSAVIPFAYDWREDLLEAVRGLDMTIQQLRAEGKDDISLIAHSLGGLIVSYYLRYGIQDIESASETWEGAQNVSAVVMAGVPFLGVMNSFRNMNFGVTVKLNSSMLTSEAYASFPSSYYTLPILEADQLLTTELQPLNGMIRTPDNWERFQWGLLNNSTNLAKEIIKRRAAYMSFWLRRSQQFLKLLQAPSKASHSTQIPLLYIYAKNSPTLFKGIWMGSGVHGANSLFFNNKEPAPSIQTIDPNILYEDGDETVSVRSALLPLAYHENFDISLKEYEVGHTELVTDLHILQNITAFLKMR